MSKLVYFLLLDQYAEWEAAYLASALRRFGHAVETVSPAATPLRSLGGFTLLPDTDVARVPTAFDGLALIGGNSWRSQSACETVPLVRRALKQGAVVGAICDAAAFLGTLGLLDHARHTCNDLAGLKAWAGDRYHGEAHFLPRQVVRDGRLVTANGTATLEFAREFLLALEAADRRDIQNWYLFHKLGCYVAPPPDM